MTEDVNRQMEREKALQKKYADLQMEIKQLQKQHRQLQEDMAMAQAQAQKMNTMENEEVSSTTNGEMNMDLVDTNTPNGDI